GNRSRLLCQLPRQALPFRGASPRTLQSFTFPRRNSIRRLTGQRTIDSVPVLALLSSAHCSCLSSLQSAGYYACGTCIEPLWQLPQALLVVQSGTSRVEARACSSCDCEQAVKAGATLPWRGFFS